MSLAPSVAANLTENEIAIIQLVAIENLNFERAAHPTLLTEVLLALRADTEQCVGSYQVPIYFAAATGINCDERDV